MKRQAVFSVQAFAQEMRPDTDVLEEAWIPFFAQLEQPVRILSLPRRFDLVAPQRRVERALQPLHKRATDFAPIAEAVMPWHAGSRAILAEHLPKLPDPLQQEVLRALGDRDPGRADSWQAVVAQMGLPLWRLRWLKDYWEYFDRKQQQQTLRGLQHYLLAWIPDGVPADAYAELVAHTFDTGVWTADLPALLAGPYTEQPRYLAPENPDAPLVTLLSSYDVTGTWDVWTLHRLLNLDLDLALAIDVGVISRTKSAFQTDFVKNATEGDLEQSRGAGDARTRKRYRAALKLEEILDTQALHELRIVIALQGRTPDELDQAARLVMSIASPRLQLMRPEHGQKPLFQFFTPTPTEEISALVRERRIPSHGVAVKLPFGKRKPSRTDGIPWIIQADTPIFFDHFPPKRASHAVFLGKTGYGKTFALFVWLLRLMVLQGHRVILFEPQSHSRRLVRAAGRGGAHYVLTLRQRTNILDVVAARDEYGNPPSLGEQVSYVVAQLSTLLGQTQMQATGRNSFTPRVWTPMERGVVERAVQLVYAGLDLDHLPPDRTPVLADLCDVLASEELARFREAQALRDELYLRLVLGPLGATVNAQTTIDWNFERQVTAYDFSQVPDNEQRIFFYAQAFGALNRYIRSPSRPRSEHTIGAIDEFGYLASMPAIVQFAYHAFKTWRTFDASGWVVDQDGHTFLGTENGTPDAAMLSIFQNATLKVIGRQDAADAGRLSQKIEGILPAHVERIKRQNVGEFTLVWDSDDAHQLHNEVFVGHIEPTDAELLALRGT
jgi:hypothetical protein